MLYRYKYCWQCLTYEYCVLDLHSWKVLMRYNYLTLSSIFLLNEKEYVMESNSVCVLSAYSNCLLKEIILTFNSTVSKYVMSNCWTVIRSWIVYLSIAVFQFNCTHTGAEVPDNRTGVRVRPVWGRESDCWERELMPTSCYCFIVATFTIIAALDLWLINYHQCIAFLYCCESCELLRQTPDGGGKTGPFCENSKIVSTPIVVA